MPLLVAGTALPLILFAAGVIYFNHMREREAAFERVLETVRAIRLVLDGEIRSVTLALEVLAGSQALARDDLDGFRRNVEALLKRYPEGSSVSLADRSGRQVFNSRAPAGEALPPRVNLDAIEEVFRTGHPYYSNLFTGSVARQRIITVNVPVFRNGQPAYEISFNPPLETFQKIIEQQRPSQDWTVSIFDRTGINFARVPNPEQTIGQRASPTLFAKLFNQPEAKLNTVSLEGVPLITAFTRSPETGWIVAAGIATATLTGPLWQALAVTAAIGGILFAIGLAFAIGMATRIARGEALHALLINELNHRVKNTLATVQSIAAQTFGHTTDIAEARRKFDARLVALGRAHDSLSEDKWQSADVREIVEGIFDPYMEKDGKRLHATGPDIRVTPRSALMMSMVLHELATNAAKYGALSITTGEIFVNWEASAGSEGSILRLTWNEVGGPPVHLAERRGFGTQLIEESFAAQLGGSAKLELNPSGLFCTLTCPRD
jgi:two-component sensor histidine kinase